MILDMLPLKLIKKVCATRRAEAMLAGWEGVRKERDIIRILRSLRYYRTAIKFLIKDRSTRKRLKRESEFKFIDRQQGKPILEDH